MVKPVFNDKKSQFLPNISLLCISGWIKEKGTVDNHRGKSGKKGVSQNCREKQARPYHQKDGPLLPVKKPVDLASVKLHTPWRKPFIPISAVMWPCWQTPCWMLSSTLFSQTLSPVRGICRWDPDTCHKEIWRQSWNPVTDTGPKIANELKSTIFDHFIKDSSTPSSYGPGLHIVRMLVKAYGVRSGVTNRCRDTPNSVRQSGLP